MVERVLGKDEVVGSIPTNGSNLFLLTFNELSEVFEVKLDSLILAHWSVIAQFKQVFSTLISLPLAPCLEFFPDVLELHGLVPPNP